VYEGNCSFELEVLANCWSLIMPFCKRSKIIHKADFQRMAVISVMYGELAVLNLGLFSRTIEYVSFIENNIMPLLSLLEVENLPEIA